MKDKLVGSISVVLLVIGCLTAMPSWAMERFDIITTEQLEQMLDQREAGEMDFLLVNALDEIIFRDAAIPGSVNVPWAQADQQITKLGTDKDRLIITY